MKAPFGMVNVLHDGIVGDAEFCSYLLSALALFMKFPYILLTFCSAFAHPFDTSPFCSVFQRPICAVSNFAMSDFRFCLLFT